jgi:putative membrane protein
MRAQKATRCLPLHLAASHHLPVLHSLAIRHGRTLGWLTPVFTAIVSYTFFGLDEIGDDLEDPFGFDENDLPCNALLRNIEREVLAALGETDLPPALEPVEYVLS